MDLLQKIALRANVRDIFLLMAVQIGKGGHGSLPHFDDRHSKAV
jgi:hypothetical protein